MRHTAESLIQVQHETTLHQNTICCIIGGSLTLCVYPNVSLLTKIQELLDWHRWRRKPGIIFDFLRDIFQQVVKQFHV